MDDPIILEGGNMNQPVLRDGRVYKDITPASETIHALLNHVREKGISWIPQSHGFHDGKHVLDFIPGEVPNDMPDWIWRESIQTETAEKMRQWHDATEDFHFPEPKWLLHSGEEEQVICHNDFAPYNCVYKHEKFQGLIDFDVCSPGSRLWDISYAAYRFIPLLPNREESRGFEISPFSREEMMERLDLFLHTYSRGEKTFLYNRKDLFLKVSKRLKALADWSRNYGEENGIEGVIKDSEMYQYHGDWVLSLIG